MSGIVAVFNRDGRPADGAAVRQMLAAAPYRGPDGLATRTLGMVGLGHAKMTVTPEDELDRQPLVGLHTGCAIVADVRLDNRSELLGRLSNGLSPHASDAAIMLRAYEEWDTDAFAEFLGDFALIIWDPRQERLVLARDTSAQRSLFYCDARQTFSAASEIHQLLQDPDVPVRPNEHRISEAFVPFNLFRNEKDQAATFYEGIYAVPAAHFLVVERGALQLRRYWELTPTKDIRYRRESDYADHYRALLLEVVRGRLRSSRPTGALLSGGLDSSSIVWAAQHLRRSGRVTGADFTTFTFTFNGLDCDETDAVREMQLGLGFAAEFVPLPRAGGRLQLEPTGFRESPNDGIKHAREAMFAAVADAGVRVLLTGDVADACVGGSPLYFDSLLRSGQLYAYWRHARTMRGAGETWRAMLLRHSLAPLLPISLHRRIEVAHIRRLYRPVRGSVMPRWMTAGLRRRLESRHLELVIGAAMQRRYASPARESEYQLLYPPELARHPAPWAIEFARPFADRRLHEYLLAIPPEVKFRPESADDSWYAASKRMVRESMGGRLPDSVRLRRRKTSFESVAAAEVVRSWADYEAAFGPTGQPEIAARGYVDQAAFWTRLQAYRDGVSGPDDMHIVQLVGLESWLRGFQLPRPQLVNVDGPSDRATRPEARTRIGPAVSVA